MSEREAKMVRRVTTGHSPAGKAVVISDTVVAGDTVALLPGADFHQLWGADVPPLFPDDGARPAAHGYFPPLGGFRFMMFTVAPQEQAKAQAQQASGNRDAMRSEIREKLPGLAEHMERSHPGMHTTDTIDFEYIISGEVWLELDDGAMVHLQAGDTVVQNGTRHAWRNFGAEPCRIVVFMVGVPRAPTGLEVAQRAG